ncbi:MAG TPA: hypothetical protein VHE78_06625 [Gemmatimonadaceae bacterium]|nr:hypothetical protein [Gemmatimonadaceae bacterium]
MAESSVNADVGNGSAETGSPECGEGESNRGARLDLAPREINSSPRQRVSFGWQRAFGWARGTWTPMLEGVALSLSEGDEALAADLLQEADIRLWELDPSRFDTRDHEWVQLQLRARMRRAAGRERRHSSPRRRVKMTEAAQEKPLLGLLEQEIGLSHE